MRAKRARDESDINRLYELLVDNLLVSCYVLHEYFGFGQKRLDDYITAVGEVVKRFDDQARDGVLDYKTAAERARYRDQFKEILRIMTKDFLSDEFYNAIFASRTPTLSEVMSKEKREQRKLTVSIAEAAKIQTAAQAFGDFLKDRSD